MYSLRRRLLLVVLGTALLVWVATAAYSYFEARHEVDELLDAHLAQSASLIAAQVGRGLGETGPERAARLDKSARRVAFQVWQGGTILRLRSANAPAERLSVSDHGFSYATVRGRQWRVFSAWDAERRTLVQVGERSHDRGEIAAGVVRALLVPLAFGLPALALLVWLGISAALRPLPALGRQVEARDPRDLATLRMDGAPAEVAPLVRALNALFARVARMIENERRFTADAAHELRTPLAALRTQAQVARAAPDAPGRQHALDNVIAGCDRATRLVEQLLTLARLEPGQLRGQAARCDLRELARHAIAELAPAALARGVDIELESGEPVLIDGHADLIAVLLRNLVDNAVRYSPPRTCVRVAAVNAGATSSIVVTDQGPGVPAPGRGRILQRFYRVAGSEASGSGLGLSIVQRIAEIHAAELALAEGPGGRGLRVSVAFNAAQPATQFPRAAGA